MTIYMLQAPTDSTSKIGSRHEHGEGCRVILGRGYTTSDAIADYATRAGYTVTEVPEIPPAYLEESARLDAWPKEYLNGGRSDGANPSSKYLVTGLDGQTSVDIRDIISGAVSA